MNEKTAKAMALTFSLLVLLSSGCRRKSERPRFTGKENFNFLLISIDTLRADRLRCYGFPGISTPTIDEMARKGVRFDTCIAQTPLTLPSHTTMLTGTYPAFHGVRDNGGFLVPQELETLAELFQKKGYKTGAVVGAYVLDSKWGLNQGFDFYYDRFDISRKEGFSMADVQRRGDEVVTEALRWLEGVVSGNFFLFLHLYDPHTPYEPPFPFREDYGHDLYLGEIAYTDAQLGRMWTYLKEKNLLDKTIVIFTSDHGESLGEHGETTHGFFIYQEGIHVPLIFVLPFPSLHNIAVKDDVSLVDVMPTVLEMAGIPVPSQVQGRSLVPLFFGDPTSQDSYAFSETYYPRFHYGWSELQSIQDGKYKLIVSPQMELFDLEKDPEEEVNLAEKEKAIAEKLEGEMGKALKKFSQGQFQTDYGKIDEETREKLASLGYIGTFVDTKKLEGKSLPSPREKIHIFNQISTAKELSLKGELVEAERIMRDVIRTEPEIIDAYFVLGNICFKQKKYEDSLSWFSGALERKPDYDFVVLNMAISYIEMNDLTKAEEILVEFVDTFPADSILYLTLGDINMKQEDYGEAIQYFQECLRVNPTSASAHNNLARVYIIQDKVEEAFSHASKAKELNPHLRNIHYNLAQILQFKGRPSEAEAEYMLELENYPDNFNASFNLALLYRERGEALEAEDFLKKTVGANPDFPLGYLFLGEIYVKEGKRQREGISLLQKAVSLGMDTPHLKLAYYLLAKAYLQMGNQKMASHYALKIQGLEKDSPSRK